MSRKPLENQIFDYESYAPLDEGDSLEFHYITLLVPVGEHPIGAKFQCALLNGAGSMLGLVDDNDNESYYDLTIHVGEKLDPDEIEDEIMAQKPHKREMFN